MLNDGCLYVHELQLIIRLVLAEYEISVAVR
jgi:hypothetical protein